SSLTVAATTLRVAETSVQPALIASRLPDFALALWRRGHHAAAVWTNEKPRRRPTARRGAGFRHHLGFAPNQSSDHPRHRPFAARHGLRRDSRGEAPSAYARARHDCLSGRLGTFALPRAHRRGVARRREGTSAHSLRGGRIVLRAEFADGA